MTGETIGNFRIVSLLGKGGMGEVWLAENTNTGTRVAIKLLLATISEDTHHVQRLFNEAIAVSRIPHPGIVRISDSGFHHGQAYLVMELLEGESLYNRVERVGPMPLAEVCEVGIQIAGVLEATHTAGVTHRDLKPDNIFLVPDATFASGARVKILDFGLAKLQGNPGMTTSTMTGMGTPLYMSPEQWRSSANVDGRADIYSLGCVIFEMACGRPPFEATGFAEACAKHLAETPPLASDIVATIPESLDRLLARMLAKLPTARPTLADVTLALEAIEQGRAISLPRVLATSDLGSSSATMLRPAGARSGRMVAATFGLGALAIAGAVVAMTRTSTDAVTPVAAIHDAGPADAASGPDPVFVSPTAVRRLTGEVPDVARSITLQVCIDQAGRITSVEVPEDIAPAVARDIAAAVTAWRYKPYTRDGGAIAACFLPTIAPPKVAVKTPKPTKPTPPKPTPPIGPTPPKPAEPTIPVPPPDVAPPEPLPERLDQRLIMTSLGQVYERANACATARRELRVTIAISPEGQVSNLVVRPATESRLVDCVTAAYERVTFPRTKQGGALNFTLALGDTPEPDPAGAGSDAGSGDPGVGEVVEAKPALGKLAITSKPSARIKIDGTDTTHDTPRTFDLVVGAHQVALARDGYAPVTAKVTVAAGKTVTFDKKLAKQRTR